MENLRIRNKGLIRLSVSEVEDAPWNFRTHPEHQYGALSGAIDELGFYGYPDVYKTPDGSYRLIDGHLRKDLLIKRYGAATKIDFNEIDFDEAEARKATLTKDPLTGLAETDTTKLDELLREVETGSEELSQMLADLASEAGLYQDEPPEVNEDDVPEPPAEPITKSGDLWILGEHRLLCGDSAKAEDVGRLMAGAKADLWLTDPPYNIAYDGGSKLREAITNDSMSSEDFREWLGSVFTLAFGVMKPGASFYIWHADSEGYNFRGAVIDSKQKTRQSLVWVKNNSTFGRQDYHWQHEPCLYGWKDGAAHGWYTDRKQTTILSFDRPSSSKEHPTMKPVALIAYQVGNSTAPQGLVYDSFLGSGSTIIAAEQLNRKCYGMEISPAYCDVIVKRWENLTGKKAILEKN